MRRRDCQYIWRIFFLAAGTHFYQLSLHRPLLLTMETERQKKRPSDCMFHSFQTQVLLLSFTSMYQIITHSKCPIRIVLRDAKCPIRIVFCPIGIEASSRFFPNFGYRQRYAANPRWPCTAPWNHTWVDSFPARKLRPEDRKCPSFLEPSTWRHCSQPQVERRIKRNPLKIYL